MNTITLYPTQTGWMARYSGPHAETVRAAFGTDTIPTAYTAKAEAEQVRREIERLNQPGVTVLLAMHCG